MNKPELIITLDATVARSVRVEWLVRALVRASAAALGRRHAPIAAVKGGTASWIPGFPSSVFAEEETCRAQIEHDISTGRLVAVVVDGVRGIRLIDLVRWAAFRNIRVEQADLPGCESFVKEAYRTLRMELAQVPAGAAGERGKMLQQEEAILTALRGMGHDPLSLPLQKNGTPGVKSSASKIVRANKVLFGGASTFPAAWARLNESGRIKYVV